MADSIAIVTLGLQYALIIIVGDLWLGASVPISVVAVTFLILTSVGLLLWHRKGLAQTAKQWGTLAVRSIILGIGLYGVDFLIALLHGRANPFHFPGGLLGLPLTFLICPGGTVICLAGFVRASYVSKLEGG
jgi:hypothetical protein